MARALTRARLASGNSNAVSRAEICAGALAGTLEFGPAVSSGPECRAPTGPDAFSGGSISAAGCWATGERDAMACAWTPKSQQWQAAAAGSRWALEAELRDQAATWLVQ